MRDLQRRLRWKRGRGRVRTTSRIQRQNQGKQPQQPSKKKQQAHKEAAPEKRASTTEAGRLGQRPYARGRAYSEGHYDDEE